jgi:hypothetical protein
MNNKTLILSIVGGCCLALLSVTFYLIINDIAADKYKFWGLLVYGFLAFWNIWLIFSSILRRNNKWYNRPSGIVLLGLLGSAGATLLFMLAQYLLHIAGVK